MLNLRDLAACQLQEMLPALADQLVEREFGRRPELQGRYGDRGRLKSRQDAGYHLQYLAAALSFGCPSIFSEYVAWARVVLARRRVQPGDFEFHLQIMAELLEERLTPDAGARATRLIQLALARYAQLPDDDPEPLFRASPRHELAQSYLDALLHGERHRASGLILDAAVHVPVMELYLQVFQPVQREVGRLWQTNRISVAEEHYCTAATQLVMSQLYHHLFVPHKKSRTLVAACVSGELHELGARMVSDLFELQGWNTYYLGANVPPEGVIAAALQRRADVVAVSATMVYHLEPARQLIQALRSALAPGVKILVGGYLLSRHPELWRRLGADGSAPDASQAVGVANKLIDHPNPA